MTDDATIDRNTKVSLGLVVLLAVNLVAISGAWFNVSARITNIESTLKRGMADRFSVRDAANQSMRMAILNPGLRVPDPENPGSVIMVEAAAVERFEGGE